MVNQLHLFKAHKKRNECTMYLYISNPTAQVKSNNDKIPYSPPDLPSDADSMGCDWYGPWLSVERLM